MLDKLKKNESFEYQKLSQDEMKSRGILGRLIGPCADFINPTRNGRGYTEDLWENVFNDDIVKEKIENKCLFGECGHPADREEVDMEKIAIALNEFPKKNEDGKLIACFDILDTPCGRILKTLCDYGTTIGISSRGSGDVIENEEGEDVVDPSTYNFECFDAVIVPAVKEARMQYVKEDLDTTKLKLKKALCESIEKASDEDKKVMNEMLKELNINLSDEATKEDSNPINEDVNKENLEQTVKETEVANNDGTDQIIKSLQEALKSNLEKDAMIESLQKEKAVSDTKVSKLEEDMNKYKSTLVRLSSLAKDSKEKDKRISTLEEQLKEKDDEINLLTKKNLTESKEVVKPLRESIDKKSKEINALNEQVSSLKASHESEVKSLNENIQSLKDELKKEKENQIAKQQQLTESLNKSKKLLESYKEFSNDVAKRYIKLRARGLGLKEEDIMGKLSNNYSLDEVDKVCEDLRSYKLNLSKLPFALDNKSVVKIQESKHIGINPTVNTDDDDYVDPKFVQSLGLK